MNKITKYAVAAAVAATIGWTYQANAMTVNWGDTGSPFVTGSDGVTPLAIGDLIEIGSDTAGTSAGFTLWATGLTSPSEGPGAGAVGDGTGVEGSFAETSGGLGAGFFSDQIYIKAFNSANSSGAYSLFTGTGWLFPATDAGTESLDVGNGGITIIVGSYSTGTVTDTNLGGPGLDAIAVAVPEPSSIALVVLGMLGGIGLIRRRR